MSSSCFQSAVLVSSPSYPNAVVWSEENLVAVASGNIVTIMNPAKPSGSRGVITIPSSKPFPIGVINGGGDDLLSGCLLPIHLSRDNRPCVRSISWSPVGLAKNAGCLLAVCTIGGCVKLYRFPFCELSTEWVKVMDLSEMLHSYLVNGNFGQPQILASECLDVIPSQDNTDLECPDALPDSTLKKASKRKRQKVAAKEFDDSGANNTRQIVPTGKPPKKLVKHSNSSLLTVHQYASRNAMLSPLIVCWSPIIGKHGKGVSVSNDSSSFCSVLAVGSKSGTISFWRIHAPEEYSIVSSGSSGKASLVGLLEAHDSWITAINWSEYGSDDSKPQLVLVTGSADGRVKIWQVSGEELLKSSEVTHASFSLLKEVIPADSSPVSVISLTVPLQNPWKLFLAIGKGSGSFEVWILDTIANKFEEVGCYSAHDHIVTGLAWAFDGRCLYSCSQDDSMKSWILVRNSLYAVQFPLNTPGLKCPDVPYVFDSCFGLAVSPGNLAIAVAHRFDADLLNPMYQERTQKAAVEFLWIGGQQLDISSPTCTDLENGPFTGFPNKELIAWENNILWSLDQYENPTQVLNIWDILSALVAFEQSIPRYVEQILLKWLNCCSETNFSQVSKLLPNLSTRKLHLINIISRRLVLRNCKMDRERESVWSELLMNSENEIRERLVGLNFSMILSQLSSSSIAFCEVAGGSPDGWLQMEQWVSLNGKNVKDRTKFLAAQFGEVQKRKLQEFFRNEVDEHCSFCSLTVPFESTEYAHCIGADNKKHKLERCAVTMRVLPTKCSWICMCCQRKASKLAPEILFIMSEYPLDFKSFLESSAYKNSSAPFCPFCGILLQRLQPEYFLSPSPA